MSAGIITPGKAVRGRRPGSNVVRAFQLFLLLFSSSAFANTSLFQDSRVCTLSFPYCKELSMFGVLVGNTADTLTLNGNASGGWSINGGIAIGTTSNFNRGTSTNTANGLVDFADAVVYNSTNCDATGSTNYCGAGTLNGTTASQNASRVNSAESQLDSIITQLLTYNTGTPGALPNSGTLNVETSGGVMLYRNTSNYSQSGALTFGCGGSTCNADDLVIVVLAGTGTQSFNFNVLLADGLTSDQLVFYLPSGNLDVRPTAAATTLSGDFFLAKSGGAHVIGGTTGASDPVALVGRLFADDGTLTFNNKGGSQTDMGVIPEPGTWALIVGGLVAIGWKARRQKQNQSGDASKGE